MKQARRYLIVMLSIVIAVAAYPITSSAASAGARGTMTTVSIDGREYAIKQTEDVIQVTAYERGKIADSCTAYPKEGYMIYKNKKQYRNSPEGASVTWMCDVVKSNPPTPRAPQLATAASPAWVRDAKYVYNPTLISVMPRKYKEHTAYYWFRNMGTDIEARTINIKKGTAVTEVVTIMIGIIATVATCGAATVAAIATTAIITSGGGLVTKSIVTNTISPSVGVLATNYESKFLNSSNKGIGAIFKGSKITVIQKNSKYYEQVFYEDYCPQRSAKFAFTAFLNTFSGQYLNYPGVKSYVEL